MNWNLQWEPKREVPIEKIRQLLDRVLPGFTRSCEAVAGRAKENVGLELDGFRFTPTDIEIAGMALLYSHHVRAMFANVPDRSVRPDVKFLSGGEDNPEAEPLKKA